VPQIRAAPDFCALAIQQDYLETRFSGYARRGYGLNMSLRKLDIGSSTGPPFRRLSRVAAPGNNVIAKKHHAARSVLLSAKHMGLEDRRDTGIRGGWVCQR